MPIEQVKPNKPNFVLILILFCVTLLVGLMLAVVFLKFDGKHLTFRHRSAEPNSFLVMPDSQQTTLVV